MPPPGETPFLSYADAFRDVLGDAPQLDHVVAVDAHEGPWWWPLAARCA